MSCASISPSAERRPGALERLQAILSWAVAQTDAAGGVIGIQFLDRVVCCCRVGNLGPSRGMLLDELAGECLGNNRTVLAQHLESAQEDRTSSFYLRFGVRSALLVPVACDGLLIGVLELLSDRPDDFHVLTRGFQKRLENLCDIDNPRRLEAVPCETTPKRGLDSDTKKLGAVVVASSLAVPTSAVSPSIPNSLPAHLAELREVIDDSSATGTWEDLLTDLAEYLRPEPEPTRTA